MTHRSWHDHRDRRARAQGRGTYLTDHGVRFTSLHTARHHGLDQVTAHKLALAGMRDRECRRREVD